MKTILNITKQLFFLFFVTTKVQAADQFIREVNDILAQATTIVNDPLSIPLIQIDSNLQNYFRGNLLDCNFFSIVANMAKIYHENEQPALFAAIILKYPNIINKIGRTQSANFVGLYGLEMWKWMANECAEHPKAQSKTKLYSYLMAILANPKEKDLLFYMFGLKGQWIEHIIKATQLHNKYEEFFEVINWALLPNDFAFKLRAFLASKSQEKEINPLTIKLEIENKEIERECSICFEEFTSDNNRFTLPCGHNNFHSSCIQRYQQIKNTACTICSGAKDNNIP